MKKIIGVLILFLAGSLFIGCGGGADASSTIIQAASIGRVGECNLATGQAVSISVTDGNSNIPVTGARIRYQVNDGKWVDLDPTTINPTPIEGPSGQYNIEIRMANHPLQTAVVFVPQDESCSVLQQTLPVKLRTPTNCPDPSKEFELNVVQPANTDGLMIKVEYPPGTLSQKECSGSNCKVPTGQIGTYTATLSGFPDDRIMELANYLVGYTYLDVEIELIVDQRVHRIVSEGVETLTLTIPYEYGDNGCLGVVFDQIIESRQHHQTPASNMVETRERQSLRVADLSSEICKRPISPIVVDYDVILPAGTALVDVKVDYWNVDDWAATSCSYRLQEHKYVCQASYDNPLFGETYNIRTTIGEKEFFGSYISLDNKCLYFE